MKIEFEGAAWQVDPLDADMVQADKIAAYTGLTLLGWYKAVTEPESPAWNRAVRCLYWLMREQNPQNGGSVPLDDSLNFRPLVLFTAFNDAQETAGEPASEDPTKPAAGSAAAELTPPQTLAG